MVVRSPAPYELGRKGCWLSRGSQLPRALPFIFSLCCLLNDRNRAAHIFSKIGRLFFIFSCLSLARLCLLNLLLLLMSGNVHPNPGPIFPCPMCARNVIWRDKSVQCCTCSKWVHPRCSQLSPQIQNSWQLLLLELTLLLHPLSQHCDFLPGLLRHLYLHCSIWPPSAKAALPPHPRIQTSYPFSVHFVSSSSSASSSLPLAPGFPCTPPAEPRAMTSLTRPFALLSLPLNFMRLPPTFPPPLPLAQTKSPSPC